MRELIYVLVVFGLIMLDPDQAYYVLSFEWLGEWFDGVMRLL